jgi:hypothetical protein
MARTEEHFIWTGDYADRISRLHAAAEAAKDDTSPRSLADGDPIGELREEYDRLREEANDAGLRVVVRALTDDEWYDLTDNHPPRTEDPHKDGDKALGFNERTGMRSLILAGLVTPEFSSLSGLSAWVTDKQLGRGDLNRIGMAIWRLTNGTTSIDPKSLPPLPTRADGENST